MRKYRARIIGAVIAVAWSLQADAQIAVFDGAPVLLVLDEAWVFLDHPAFAGRIRE